MDYFLKILGILPNARQGTLSDLDGSKMTAVDRTPPQEDYILGNSNPENDFELTAAMNVPTLVSAARLMTIKDHAEIYNPMLGADEVFTQVIQTPAAATSVPATHGGYIRSPRWRCKQNKF